MLECLEKFDIFERKEKSIVCTDTHTIQCQISVLETEAQPQILNRICHHNFEQNALYPQDDGTSLALQIHNNFWIVPETLVFIRCFFTSGLRTLATCGIMDRFPPGFLGSCMSCVFVGFHQLRD